MIRQALKACLTTRQTDTLKNSLKQHGICTGEYADFWHHNNDYALEVLATAAFPLLYAGERVLIPDSVEALHRKLVFHCGMSGIHRESNWVEAIRNIAEQELERICLSL